VRQALAKSGFQAQATALAVPETELQRFSLTLDAGLNARQMHQAIAAQLNSLLTLPLIDAVWDFEISVHNATASPLPGN
jgi:Tfp pilus assembly PilM family ATPase